MILPIVKWPSDTLKKPSAPVGLLNNPFELVGETGHTGYTVPHLIADLQETLAVSGGVGLSAIQCGIPLRIVVTVFPDMRVLLNPEINPKGAHREAQEGCLSLPGLFLPITRREEAEVTYMTPEGIVRTRSCTGLEARCLLHEAEHLEGDFFLKHVPAARRDQIRSQLKRSRR